MLRFNTHRPYSAHGQRIAAMELADGSVLFADLDRCVEGVIENPGEFGLTKPAVMARYDACHYKMPGPEHSEQIALLRRTAADATK